MKRKGPEGVTCVGVRDQCQGQGRRTHDIREPLEVVVFRTKHIHWGPHDTVVQPRQFTEHSDDIRGAHALLNKTCSSGSLL